MSISDAILFCVQVLIHIDFDRIMSQLCFYDVSAWITFGKIVPILVFPIKLYHNCDQRKY